MPSLPLPLREGGGGRGSRITRSPLPPTPSRKGRGRLSPHRDHQIRRRGARAGAPHALGLDRVRRFPQPGGIHQRHRHAAQHHARLQRIARGAGRCRDDRHVALGQRIHQRRLADVRRAGDREHQPLAQPLAAPVIVRDARHLAPQRRQLGKHLRLDLGRQVLVREVDQRLLLRQQQRAAGPPSRDTACPARHRAGAAPGAAAPRSPRRPDRAPPRPRSGPSGR